jgi:Lon protease-like protein
MKPLRPAAPPALECASPSGLVPVFPLPGVVFFPRTILPFHVFEPRYRAMVRDAIAGEALIAVALLRPGWEANYEGEPAFHETGTVGRIEDLVSLSDGKFNLRLVGLQRVAFGEVVRSKPYRLVRVRALGESTVDESDPAIRAGKLDLLASHGCLMRELTDGTEAGAVFDERIPFETAVNGACANLPVEPAVRQSLLEENDLLARHRRASALLDEILARVFRLKALRSSDEGGPGVN